MSRLLCPVLSALVVAAFSPLCTPASAQLSSFDWTFSGDPSGSGAVGSDALHIVGPSWDQCTTGQLYGWLTTTAPAAGTVSAHYAFENQDGGFGWWTAEDPVFVVNGAMTVVGPGDIFDTWEGDVSFHVQAGDTFGFGVVSIDCSFGPGVLDVNGFGFVADAWQSLGHGLAGVDGVPVLEGLGSLQAGTPCTLGLGKAAELAPAWLVLGVAELEAPFKGGVLVPDPAPPAVLLLFNTDASGRIVLSGSWPSGLPAGFTFVMQYWIVDAAGPAGFSASQGLSATTP